MRALFLSIPLLGLLPLLAACSNDGSESKAGSTKVEQSVGPSGGKIELLRATVTFPKGALAEETMITIEETDEAAPDGFTALSPIFSCSPSGLAFEPAVSMAMEFEGKGESATMFWSSGEDPTFTDVGGKVSGNVMTAGVAHFSRGFVGEKR